MADTNEDMVYDALEGAMVMGYELGLSRSQLVGMTHRAILKLMIEEDWDGGAGVELETAVTTTEVVDVTGAWLVTHLEKAGRQRWADRLGDWLDKRRHPLEWKDGMH